MSNLFPTKTLGLLQLQLQLHVWRRMPAIALCSALWGLLIFTLAGMEKAEAASFYVPDAIAEGNINKADVRAATSLVRSAVSSRATDTLVQDEFRADYILQPRLMPLGESLILTVEKVRGQEVLFAAQTKINSIDQLDRAARSATFAAIDEPTLKRITPDRAIAAEDIAPVVPYQVVPPVVAAPIYEGAPDRIAEGRVIGRPVIVLDERRKVNYWTIGVGPFVSRRLQDDSLMYNFAIGHVWDINPRASVKTIGEASLSSGGEGSRFFNFAIGASYFFPSTVDQGPYVTADFGYGFAENAENVTAEGFSFGTGLGMQFFRNTETTLDLLLRYSVILDAVDEFGGNPSVIGLRMAVNF